MDHIKKKRYQNYAVGVLIALALYILSRNVGALLNVFVSYAAGYRHYQDFQSSDHFAAFLVIAIAGVVIHAFTGWLTVQLMTKYGQKRACVTRWYFRNAAIAVVVLAVIVLPLLSRAPGWLTYSSHALAILIFGERKVQQYSQTCRHSGALRSCLLPSVRGKIGRACTFLPQMRHADRMTVLRCAAHILYKTIKTSAPGGACPWR